MFPDLPPSLVTELLAALVGVLAAVALVVRGLPAIADRIVKVLESHAKARETDSQSHADALHAAEKRAQVAESALDEERDAHDATRRLLKASNDDNARLREQWAQTRGGR